MLDTTLWVFGLHCYVKTHLCDSSSTTSATLIDRMPFYSGPNNLQKLGKRLQFQLIRKSHPWSTRCRSICFEPPPEQMDQAVQSQDTCEKKFPIFISGSFDNDLSERLCTSKDLKLPDGAALLYGRDKHIINSGSGSFNCEAYLQRLSTEMFGKHFLWSPCLPSTHTLLSQNFAFFPVGTVCVADSQVSGKGRTSNVWESPKGCLMFSYTVEMENGHMLPFLQYVVSIAMLDAIENICTQKGLPLLPIKIKWPNDIYANGVKIGGVLCTSTYREKRFNVVIGIGLNVGNQIPTTCLDAILLDIVPEAPAFQREELLASFFEKFESLFNTFLKYGFQALENSYYNKWLHSGQLVQLEEKQDDNRIKTVQLVIQGLSPTGYLRATDHQMESYELHPDGNSFDFLKGLLRTKLR